MKDVGGIVRRGRLRFICKRLDPAFELGLILTAWYLDNVPSLSIHSHTGVAYAQHFKIEEDTLIHALLTCRVRLARKFKHPRDESAGL